MYFGSVSFRFVVRQNVASPRSQTILGHQGDKRRQDGATGWMDGCVCGFKSTGSMVGLIMCVLLWYRHCHLPSVVDRGLHGLIKIVTVLDGTVACCLYGKDTEE